MKTAGEDVVSFGAGEPDFPTPEPIRRAAAEALEGGQTRYTPSAGTAALREAIAAKLLREDGLTYAPGQIVAACGAKQALYETFQVLLGPGDEAIVIAPYWMTYADQIRLAGGAPIVVPTSAEYGFVPDPERVRSAITPRTRVLIVNSPSNPAGAVIPETVAHELARIAEDAGLWIVSDEIYKRLVYDGARATSMATLAPDRTVTINGASKAFAMTGWRIGFAAAPLEVARAIANLQDQVTSNPTSFAQAGAVRAFADAALDAEVERMRAEFQARRDLIVAALNEIEGVACPTPEGAFYVLPDVRALLRAGEDDAGLAAALLAEAKVAVVPGGVFGAPGHIRLSYATSRDEIERGVARIAAFARRAEAGA